MCFPYRLRNLRKMARCTYAYPPLESASHPAFTTQKSRLSPTRSGSPVCRDRRTTRMMRRTTMSRAFPWEQIATPIVDYNVRLTSRDKAVPTYWGKDALGQWLTIVELTGDHFAEFRCEPVIVHGISVDLRAGESAGTQRLVLTL